MTLEQEIEAIYKLDKERTQGTIVPYDNFIEAEYCYDHGGVVTEKEIIAEFFNKSGDSSGDTYFYASAPQMVSIIRRLKAKLKEQQDDIEFMAKQVERGLFDKNSGLRPALMNIFYYPNAPWNHPEWTWDISHKEYAEEFNKVLNRHKK